MYEFVNADAASQLRAERIHHLEVQHFRLALELEEAPGIPAIVTQMAELERRIGVHRNALGLAPLDAPAQENGQTVDDAVADPEE